MWYVQCSLYGTEVLVVKKLWVFSTLGRCRFVVDMHNISKEDIKLNYEFWENYKKLVKQYKYDNLHKNYESFFSPSFLKKNPQFFK